jgi:tetratricopeptide (TPR) repeat protein/transcriptional regulator with XRE-family HTH domain
MERPQQIGDWLRRRRELAMLTQEMLAERSGVSARSISDIENGRTGRPRASTMRMLTDALADALAGAEQSAGGALHTELPQPPRELPAGTSGFTGRSAELAELTEFAHAGLAGTTVTIIGISGPPGVGKTALVTHWAHQVDELFPDGQLYVSLCGYDAQRTLSPEDALGGLLRGLGVAAAEIPRELAERAGLYRSLLAGRRMLVVLDDALDADHVHQLMPGSAHCTVLVTSRDQLAGLSVEYGAHCLEVGPLPPRDAHALLRRHIGREVDEEPGAAAELVDQCGRLPLALRVAAQLAVSRSPRGLSRLVAELTDERMRLDVLDVGGTRSSVRAVFSSSYGHLTPDVRDLFRLLGAYPGHDFEVHALAAFTDTAFPEVLPRLAVLNRAHLIREVAEDRFEMHDLVRIYATELLADTEDQPAAHRTAIDRLCEYYLQATTRAMDRLAPYGHESRPHAAEPTRAVPEFDAESAAGWLDAECANIVAAAVVAADAGLADYAVGLSMALFGFLINGGHDTDAERLYTAVYSACEPADQPVMISRLASVLSRQGRYEEAVERHLAALTKLRQHPDLKVEAAVSTNLGNAYRRMGRFEEARRYQEEAVRLADQLDDRWGRARVRDNLGKTLQRMGHPELALAHQQASIALYTEVGDLTSAASVAGNAGLTRAQLGQRAEALRCHESALAALTGPDNVRARGEALNDLGCTLFELGDLDNAVERHHQAAECAAAADDPYELQRARTGLRRCAAARTT